MKLGFLENLCSLGTWLNFFFLLLFDFADLGFWGVSELGFVDFCGFAVYLDVKMAILPTNDSIQIREVWNDSLDDEFALIRELVDDYPYIAMDTEFPGTIVRPLQDLLPYSTLKENVDLLKLIQVGLTFSDEEGNLPTCGTGKYCVWQFTFREFDLDKDVYAHDSITLLTDCGFDFKKNNEKGIDVLRFSELLMSSGIVLNENVRWVTFHSAFDFGYLVKVLTCRKLPETREGFSHLLNVYFPVIFDIKHLMRYSNSLHGGLNKLAQLLGVERVGTRHQAGSDSLLTCCAFFRMKEHYFKGSLDKYAGVLYGLDIGYPDTTTGVVNER